MTSKVMTSDEKKAILLLKSVIFHYHGLDKEEQQILDSTAERFDAWEELKWANDFISLDYYTAFERAREYLNEVVGNLDKETRLNYLSMVWEANNAKGYVTEMEATAMLKLAKDWSVQKELMMLVRKKK
ncbi:hypothetical protein [Microscilla marina]|jgi:uncharacterized tellurite resistance protein B-like protein|uniref:Co-chaperone DjlA N-terminal domain-containing protein n=1 Tax=Microscilla marina ATCC 23134 TaxID=313606 RepID=A1ZTV0_MICM2|nr:hypothetical protein [Microscilla marina]EAY26202.1 hypothetical protein M23134_02534 [Microscilla marina ATCC 23134]